MAIVLEKNLELSKVFRGEQMGMIKAEASLTTISLSPRMFGLWWEAGITSQAKEKYETRDSFFCPLDILAGNWVGSMGTIN